MQSNTVLVLGAGAGVDIDMPTGEMLSDQIAKNVNIRFENGTTKVSGNDGTCAAIYRYARTSNTNVNDLFAAGRAIAQGIHYTRSIDSYIHTHRDNEHIKTCAKIAIVETIIESEKRSKIFVNDTKHPKKFRGRNGFLNSWLRDLIYILQDGIVAKETLKNFANNIAIVNFNYDRCIEHCLFRVLQELYLINEECAKDIVNSIKIFHPYGKVAPLPWQSNSGVAFGGDPYGNELDLPSLAKNIRTFNEEVDEGDELRQMRGTLGGASNVVFLGFHFHKQNLELLKPIGEKADRHVYGTAKDRSNSEVTIISQRIDELFQPIARETSTHIVKTDCKGLFREYGTTFTK